MVLAVLTGLTGVVLDAAVQPTTVAATKANRAIARIFFI